MLRFFHALRHRLLTENKFSKYLLYAVGEILLVVIGILLALQVNNWNEARKTRIKERQSLENISENLEWNVAMLQRTLSNIENSNASRDLILYVIDHHLPDHDSLGVHWHAAFLNMANFTAQKSGYESLKESGIGIISNENLKKEIVDLFENTYLIMEDRLKWGMAQNPSWDSYVVRNFSRASRLDTGIKHPRNLDFIAGDDYFFGLLELADGQRNFFKLFFEESLKGSTRVQMSIERELR